MHLPKIRGGRLDKHIASICGARFDARTIHVLLLLEELKLDFKRVSTLLIEV